MEYSPQDESDILKLKFDKNEYKVGDELKISAKFLSDKGYALIVLESNGRLIKKELVKITNKNFIYKFRVEDNMFPNAYVHLSYFNEHKNTSDFSPLRMYSSASFKVKENNLILIPKTKLKEEYKSREKISFDVFEENSKEMTYNIMLVDEGVLVLTNYQTPSLYDYFYSKRASSLSKYDLYNYIASYYQADPNNILTLGGGGADATARFVMLKKLASLGSNEKIFNNLVSKSIVLGPFHINKGEKKTHEIKLPKKLGAFRLMIVAKNNSNAFGSFAKTIKIVEPLMATLPLLRVLNYKDSIEIPVNIFTNKKINGDITVNFQTEDGLELLSDNKILLKNNLKNKLAIFKIKALKIGNYAFKVKLKSSDGFTFDLESKVLVKYPSTRVEKAETVILAEKEEKKVKKEFFGYKGTNYAYLEYSAFPSLFINKHINDIDNFDYYYLNSAIFTGFSKLHLNSFLEMDDKEKQKIQKDVKYAIVSMKKYLRSNGGFSKLYYV